MYILKWGLRGSDLFTAHPTDVQSNWGSSREVKGQVITVNSLSCSLNHSCDPLCVLLIADINFLSAICATEAALWDRTKSASLHSPWLFCQFTECHSSRPLLVGTNHQEHPTITCCFGNALTHSTCHHNFVIYKLILILTLAFPAFNTSIKRNCSLAA